MTRKLTELVMGEVEHKNIRPLGTPKIISIPKYKTITNFTPPEIIKNAPKNADAYVIGEKGGFNIKTSVLGQNKKRYSNFVIEDDDVCYNFYPVQYYKIRK
jgi:hypothetical protein